jgi:ATP-binding cassette, subfamily B, bacterial AbcA/BmrA
MEQGGETHRGGFGGGGMGGRPGSGDIDPAAPKASLGEFVKLIGSAKPSAPALALALILGGVSTVGGLLVPLLTKGLVNGFSLSSVGAGQVGLIAAAFLVQAAAGALSGYLLARVGQGVVASLRERLWRKELSFLVPGFDKEGSGALVSRMTNDTAVVMAFITDNLAALVTGAISIAGAVGFLLYLNWKMTLIILGALPVAALVLVPIGGFMSKLARRTMDENAAFTGILSRVLSEIRLVKSSNAEEREFRAGKAAIGALRALGVREGAAMALISPVMSLVMMSLLVLVIGYGGSQVAAGALTAGDLVAFILYIFQVIMPVAMISQAVTQLQKARGATESIVALLAEPEERTGEGIALGRVDEAIRLEEVAFSYEPGKGVLRGLSFDLEPGSVTAIVGPSGGGKTTIFSLLERFYEPDSGAILLGERSIRDYSLASWRGAIGYVSQDSPLMAGTIRDNICYGVDSGAAGYDSRVREAARAAYADEFIELLPRGYDTDVGDRGVKLSGGQRQRIAIARALLRDPSILMLDEATSSLDSASEEWVQKALDNLMRGRTTLVIAHRLSTVLDADRILFIEGGRLTGSGSHEELLETHELYRSFAERQLRVPAAEPARAAT